MRGVNICAFGNLLKFLLCWAVIGRAEIDVNFIHAQKDNIPVLRRSSGGGTVLQGPGCLNYTLILSKQKHPELNDLRKSYEWISAKVIEALRQAGVEAYFRPTSDLATGTGREKIFRQCPAPSEALYFASWHDPLQVRSVSH